jgi:hypothetical protein
VSQEFWYLQKRKSGAIYCPTICKECSIKLQQERYFKDHKKNKKYQVEWNKKNKKKRADNNKKFYSKNKPQRRIYLKQYNQTEIFKCNNKYKYIPKRSIKTHEITTNEWDACKLYFNYRCAYCGKTWEENERETLKDLHREHVVVNGRNDLKNCVPSCVSCNSSKGEQTLNKWYKGQQFFSRDNYLMIYRWLRYDVKKYIEKKQPKKKYAKRKRFK